MNAPKATRVRFSIAKKVELLDLFRKGRSRTDICRDYGIASSTLFNFIKDESKIRGEFEKNRDSKRQMIKNAPFHELEQALVKWIRVVREKKIALNFQSQ